MLVCAALHVCAVAERRAWNEKAIGGERIPEDSRGGGDGVGVDSRGGDVTSAGGQRLDSGSTVSVVRGNRGGVDDRDDSL